MPLDQENTRPIFRRLARQLSKLADKPVPENVHKFRTSSRRVEGLVADLAQERSRNDKKLLKLLGRLRKKAGRVRDLDVQTAALRSLKIPQEPGRKSQLLRTLAEQRGKREKKLVRALDKKAITEVRKRLKRAAASLEIPKNADPVTLAIQKVAGTRIRPEQRGRGNACTASGLPESGHAISRNLRARTLKPSRVVAQLKHMQDVIGDWHDWAQLAEKAEKLFGGVQDSALVAALRNITRAKFRQAVNTLTETRAAWPEKARFGNDFGPSAVTRGVCSGFSCRLASVLNCSL